MQEIVLAKVHGGHVNWVFVVIEFVYWYVWTVYTPLVIGLAKRFPLTGPRFITHIAIHTITALLTAPLASVTEYTGRLEIAAQRHNGRVSLCLRDDGPGPQPGSRLRFGVGLTSVQSRLKQLYGEEPSTGPAPVYVFVTAHDAHAIRAFEVGSG